MVKKITARSQIDKFASDLSLDFAEARMRNDRQTIFLLVRELVHAQFELDDPELTNRLWQDVLDRGIDLDRVINLMYSCSFHDDYQAMLDADLAFERIS